MGDVLEPRAWCRERRCREGGEIEHRPGDGCSCHPLGRAGEAEPEARITVLRARASRLPAFACRACGRAARRMVECPTLFFRCEDCAAADRWPDLSRRGARR
jgi:hypothetical protein